MSANLDPQPWLFISDQVFGEHRSAVDEGFHGVSGAYWVFKPRTGYEQDLVKYEQPRQKDVGSGPHLADTNDPAPTVQEAVREEFRRLAVEIRLRYPLPSLDQLVPEYVTNEAMHFLADEMEGLHA